MTVLEMTSNLPVLSENTVTKLKHLRESDPEHFYALVKALRLNHWPLRAIGDPLGASKYSVSLWENKYNSMIALPETEKMPELSKEMRPMYYKYEMDEPEKKKLYKLARKASKVRRYTDKNAPSRKAAKELELKLREHKEKGASLNYLAGICGVSRRAIAQRLEKTQDAQN